MSTVADLPCSSATRWPKTLGSWLVSQPVGPVTTKLCDMAMRVAPAPKPASRFGRPSAGVPVWVLSSRLQDGLHPARQGAELERLPDHLNAGWQHWADVAGDEQHGQFRKAVAGRLGHLPHIHAT